MLKFYKRLSNGVRICYVLSFIALIIIFALSIIMFYNANPQTAGTADTILITLSIAVISIASLVSCMLMKNTIILSEKNIKTSGSLIFQLKHIISFLALVSLVSFAISMMGGIVISFVLDMFTTMRYDNFPLFCTIIKVPLFIIFLVFLAFIARHTGFNDITENAFNPHLMLIAIIFSLTFMLPGTVRDYIHENSDNRGNVSSNTSKTAAADQGKMYFNLQTVFSQNTNLYKDSDNYIINDKFSISWMIAGMLISMAVQASVAMVAYNMGRKAYYAKHPSMSEEELYGYLPDAN